MKFFLMNSLPHRMEIRSNLCVQTFEVAQCISNSFVPFLGRNLRSYHSNSETFSAVLFHQIIFLFQHFANQYHMLFWTAFSFSQFWKLLRYILPERFLIQLERRENKTKPFRSPGLFLSWHSLIDLIHNALISGEDALRRYISAPASFLIQTAHLLGSLSTDSVCPIPFVWEKTPVAGVFCKKLWGNHQELWLVNGGNHRPIKTNCGYSNDSSGHRARNFWRSD